MIRDRIMMKNLNLQAKRRKIKQTEEKLRAVKFLMKRNRELSKDKS